MSEYNQAIYDAHKKINELLSHIITNEERRALHNAQVVVLSLLREEDQSEEVRRADVRPS